MEKQIELGARVQAEDGAVGTVDKIVIDPDEREPEYLVIKRGPMRPRKIVVPVSLVTDVSGDGVTLDTTRKAFKSFPDYEVTVREGDYRKPVPVAGTQSVAVYTPPTNRGYVELRQRNLPETSVAVENGMDVVDIGGDVVGKVRGLIAETGVREASHLVLRQQHPLRPRERLVPSDLVAEVREGEVHLRIPAEHLSGLRPYEPTPEEDQR
jgi:sporulation protein YlmC with PRC-barrel domain